MKATANHDSPIVIYYITEQLNLFITKTKKPV